MRKTIVAAAFAAAALALSAPASAAPNCPLPLWPDVLGQCVCPNQPDKIKLRAAGYGPQLDAMCPKAAKIGWSQGRERGTRFTWYRDDDRDGVVDPGETRLRYDYEGETNIPPDAVPAN